MAVQMRGFIREAPAPPTPNKATAHFLADTDISEAEPIAATPIVSRKLRRKIVSNASDKSSYLSEAANSAMVCVIVFPTILDRFFFTRKHLMDQNSSLGKVQNAARSSWSGKFYNAADDLFWFTEGRFLTLSGPRYAFLVVR